MNKNKDSSDLNQVFSVWRSSLIKSSQFVFPILIFSICFANLLMICMYGDNYSSSTLYFQIRNTSALLQIIPFAPIILSIGKTKEYANAHLITAILIVSLEYVAVKTIDSPIAVAVVSELCRVFNICLQMGIIVRYFNVDLSLLFPSKVLGKVLLVSILSSFVPLLFIHFTSINKFLLLIICFFLYVICYYIFCWCFKLSYKEIASSFFKSISQSKIFKLIP